MGEREITERVEVTERESVHVCDFCGRSSDEFDGTFNEVYKNPNVVLPHYSNNRFNDKIMTSTVHGEAKINRWIGDDGLVTDADEVKHYCNECHSAHLEVHNDDN